MLRLLARAAERFCGIRVTRIASDNRARFSDLSPEIHETIRRVRPYTMTSPERLASLCLAVEHVVASDVPGDFVECGVWRGGSSMAAAWTYQRLQKRDVDLHLFDTFSGMSEPSTEDVDLSTGKPARELLASSSRDSQIWACATLKDVQANLMQTEYPANRLHFIQGKVEDTIPGRAPDRISLLRLDTDWYESTKHELTHLFPRLSPNGILIIDDYGAWAGARKAVDEYFAENGMRPFLSRIDVTGRILVRA
jgi:O-methyltransferase